MTLQMEPPVPPPRRSVSTTCDLHPGETFTGFCAACLRERLAGLESTGSAAAAAPGRRSTSAIRSLFSRSLAAANGAPSGSGVATLPDLRRCKSFSCGRGGDALAAAGKPQRRSCDVRGRSTLWALFHQDDRQAGGNDRLNAFLTARGVPKETSHVAKYNFNAAAAYRDRIAALAEGKPWTDPPVVKETPGSGAPAPARKPPLHASGGGGGWDDWDDDFWPDMRRNQSVGSFAATGAQSGRQ